MTAKMDDQSEALPQPNPELQFLSLIWELNHALELSSQRMSKTLDVTAQQRLIIRIVGRFPHATASVLSRLLHVDPGTLSTNLARLEKRGLIARERSAQDRRRITIGLTPAGRALDRPTHGTVESAVGRLLASASSSELSAMRRCVRGLIEELDKGAEPPDASPDAMDSSRAVAGELSPFDSPVRFLVASRTTRRRGS
jgi:DNA-binding MarR family transcriptional regulator